jgi:hypothetical protein
MRIRLKPGTGLYKCLSILAVLAFPGMFFIGASVFLCGIPVIVAHKIMPGEYFYNLLIYSLISMVYVAAYLYLYEPHGPSGPSEPDIDSYPTI